MGFELGTTHIMNSPLIHRYCMNIYLHEPVKKILSSEHAVHDSPKQCCLVSPITAYQHSKRLAIFWQPPEFSAVYSEKLNLFPLFKFID
ncbi:hypothetical protein EG68_02553 [Paragonimus skrjabini miyazakii]|uniref:Uncharacterized protein n=1 Tax=Paragonimus skrjabini miyazakii TaxID=59628 RepID=A0A8S9Z8X7_9TREM|nr:hypothetical protein EG68_02553 [Paragonimus skrjabini miyazakii]